MSWEKVSLDKICTILSGNAWTAAKFKDAGEIPIIRIQNLGNNENEKFIWWDEPYDKKYIVTKGDILLSLSGSIKVDVWNGIDALLNQRIVKLIPNKNIDHKWFYWQITNIILDIERMGKWALVNNVSITDLKDLEIPLPPLSTQKRIAEILDAADALRRKDQELLKKYDELAQAIFIDMFGDPVKNEKGWERQIATKYYEVRGRVGWKGYKKTDLRQKGAIVIGASHVTNTGYIDLSNPVYLSEEKFIESPEIVVKKNDLIFVQRGNTIGKIGLVRDDIAKATINPVVLIFRPKDVNPFFLLYLILNKEQNREFVSSNSGSAQPMITQEFMRNYYLINVPKVLQDKFGTNIKIIENQKNKAENSLIKSESLFDSLIQKAFKGELVA